MIMTNGYPIQGAESFGESPLWGLLSVVLNGYLLMSMYPRKADLQKLVYLDYATIYSADFQGPSSLHTPVADD